MEAMACSEWRDHLLEKLYGEIDGDRLAELDRHLLACDACTRELDSIGLAHKTLAGASPDVPEPPGLILLREEVAPAGNWWRRPGGFRMFAAGFAAATVLLAAGLATGLAMSPEPEARIDMVNQSQMQQALDSREARLMNLLDQRSEQVHTSMAEFGSTMESRRKEDFRLLVGELISSEMWTGRAIHENRESLRHLALASQPGVTQW
jgi:anti-sigma factor RsiW